MIQKYKAPKKKKQKKPKTEKELLEKENNDLWKEKALKLYGDKCLICENHLSTHHHYIPKSRSIFLRYHIKNAIPICYLCHYKIHFSSKPTEVAEIVETIKEVKGKEWCEWIKANEYTKANRTIKFLEFCRSELEKL